MKQGVAEWFRLQLKEKTWKGLRRAHPGRLEHRPRPLRLPSRPHRAPRPRQSLPRPHQDPPRPGPRSGRRWWRRSSPGGSCTSSACPRSPPGSTPTPPGTRRRPGKGWTTPTVWGHLGQPEVHRAHGLRPWIRNRNGHRVTVPASEWLRTPRAWSTPPSWTGPTWDTAQQVAAEHGTSRDGHLPSATTPPPPAPTPTASRVRCRDGPRCWWRCQRLRPPNVYYQCPHNPANPRHAASFPSPPPHRQGPGPQARPGGRLVLQGPRCSAPAGPSCSPPSSPPPTPPRPPTATPATAALHRPAEEDHHRAGLLHPRTRAAPRRPRRHRCCRDAGPDPGQVRRAPRPTRAAPGPARCPRGDHPQGRGPLAARRAPLAGTSCPACPTTSKPACPTRSTSRSCRTTRPAGHRLGRDHQRHPPRPPRHPQPRPGRVR